MQPGTSQPADDREDASTDDQGSLLGSLLDEVDEAAEGGSNDDEIAALHAALDTAVAMLIDCGVEIPRADTAEPGDEPKPTVHDHDARPDDNPEPGDRCKDCGGPVTWVGPSHNHWLHADEEQA